MTMMIDAYDTSAKGIISNLSKRLSRLEQFSTSSDATGALPSDPSFTSVGLPGGVTLDNVPPAAPGGFTATPGTLYQDVFIDVDITPATPAPPTGTSYQISVARKDQITGLYSYVTIINSNVTHVRIPGLQPAVTYGIQVRAISQTMFSSTPYPATGFTDVVTLADATVPSTVTGLAVAAGIATLTASWTDVTDPNVKNGAGTYQLQVATNSGFTTGLIDRVVSGTVASVTVASGTLFYVRVRAVSASGVPGGWSGTQTGTTGSVPVADGIVPASSPTPVVASGYNSLVASWSPVTNHDLVTYHVYISATTGFTPNETTNKVGEVTGTSFVINKLNGGGALVVGTTYYVRIVAYDVDGAGPAGTQASATLTQVGTADVAAAAITAAKMSVAAIDSVTGNLTASSVGTTQIAAGAVVANSLAQGSVTALKVGFTVGGDNRLTNSSFEDATGYFNNWAVGTAGTIAASTAIVHNGGKSVQVNHVTGSASAIQGNALNVLSGVAGDLVTFSAWVYLTNAAVSVYVDLISVAPSTAFDLANALADTTKLNQWQRISGTYVLPNSSTNVLPRVVCTGASPNNTFYVDDLQYEYGDLITAYAPRPDEIMPGSITTTQIADGSITTPKLVAGSVVTGSIAAGAVTATQIAAGAVTTEKLTVGNIGPELVVNGGFEDASSLGLNWIASGWKSDGAGTSVVTTLDSHGGTKALQITADATYPAYTGLFPCAAGDVIGGSIWAKQKTASTALYFRLNFHDSTGAFMSSQDLVSLAVVPAAWTRYTNTVTAPANTKFCSVQVYNTSGAIYVDDVSLRQVVVSAQIADGAIVASKILAGAVTAEKLTVGSMTDNLLLNPGFEEATTVGLPYVAANWALAAAPWSPYVALDTASPIGGTQSMKMTPLYNYVNGTDNSSFETGVGNWSSVSATIASSTTAGAVNGTHSLAVTPTGSNQDCYAVLNVTSLTPGSQYTVSGSVTLTAAQTGSLDTRARTIQLYYFNGATLLGGDNSNQAANSAGTTRVTKTFTVPATTTRVEVRLYNGSSTVGNVVYWDGIQVEVGAAATAFTTTGQHALLYPAPIVIPGTAGDTYYFSVMLRGSVAGCQAQVSVFNGAVTASLVAMGVTTISTTATRYECTFTLTSSYPTFIPVIYALAGGTLGGSIWADDVQLRRVVVSAQIADGAIVASKIAAGAVTTEKLTVGVMGDNRVMNASFEETSSADSTLPARWTRNLIWGTTTTSTGLSTTSPALIAGSQSATLSAVTVGGTRNSGDLYSEPFPVKNNDTWVVSCLAKIAAAGQGASFFLRLRGGPTQSDVSQEMQIGVEGVLPLSSGSTLYSGQGVIPSGMKWARVCLLNYGPGGTSDSTVVVDQAYAAPVIISAQIADGAITTPKLIAGSVTTEKLTIGSAGASIVMNGSFEDRGAPIDNPNGATSSTAPALDYAAGGGLGAAKWSGSYSAGCGAYTENNNRGSGNTTLVLLATGSGVQAYANSDYVPVRPGGTYFGSLGAVATSAATGGFYFRIKWFTNARVFISDSDIIANATLAVNTSIRATDTISGSVVAPSNAAFASIYLYNSSPSASTYMVVDQVIFQPVTLSAQIADGAITTPKLVAGAVTANEIAANTITAAKIAAGTITANEIQSFSITSTQIAVGTLNSNQIQAGSLTADRLTAGTLTATQIQAGTITGTQIAANSIQVDKLTTGTLTSTTFTIGTGGSLVAGSPAGGAGTGLLIDSTGLRLFSAGTATLTMAASSGAVSMMGALTTGSTITGATITAGTVTGAILRTSSSSTAQRVVIDPANLSNTGGIQIWPTGTTNRPGTIYGNQYTSGAQNASDVTISSGRASSGSSVSFITVNPYDSGGTGNVDIGGTNLQTGPSGASFDSWALRVGATIVGGASGNTGSNFWANPSTGNVRIGTNTALAIQDPSGAAYKPVNGGLYTNASLSKWKSDISKHTYGLEAVKKLRLVQFLLKDNPESGLNLGVIAEEVALVAPEAVSRYGPEGDSRGLHAGEVFGVDLMGMISLGLGGLQEAAARIELLEHAVAGLALAKLK